MRIEERFPTTEEYLGLRSSVDWVVPSREDGERSLEGSWAAVCAVDGERVVGMGRLISDGVFYFMAVDVVVDPAYQRRGVGSQIMRKLEEVVARAGGNRVVNLTATTNVADFYVNIGYRFAWSVFMEKKL